jgi:two-component system, OmpR family, sensor kinase
MSKERDIVLTSYERKALLRFLALYLGSVFVLLAIIGRLFFAHNAEMMTSSIKFEMMYQARKLSMRIFEASMEQPIGALFRESSETLVGERERFLGALKHCRFDVGYYDAQGRDLYTEIPEAVDFDTDFQIFGGACYTVVEDPAEHLGVRYIILRENKLSDEIAFLRMRIISYLILSFLFMGLVGYFLARLFLAPVRNKIESLDRFISDTTHELNTPVSAILMTIQGLKGCEPKKIKRLEASAKRLSTIYGSLTYRLRGENRKEHIESFWLDRMLTERMEYMRELIDAKKLQTRLFVEPMRVEMDRESALRLIDNLLSNAIKYSDPGQTITLSIAGRRFEIRDQGIGIDPEAHRDIFKRYKRANKERGGFGIGLDIVWSICKRYNIAIEVESQKGKGSCFILRFPKGSG